MLNSISWLGETRHEQEWPNGIFRSFRFSGILGQPCEVHPKFQNETPENVCSIRFHTWNFRKFWSNGKRPQSSTTELKFHEKITPDTDPCYPANDQKNILFSNATPIGVYKMQSADCTQAVLDCRFSTD